MIDPEDLDALPLARPRHSCHPWWVWLWGQVELDPKLACDTLRCTHHTLKQKLSGFRPIRTEEVYRLISAWVARGRHVTLEHVGEFVLLHGRVRNHKEASNAKT